MKQLLSIAILSLLSLAAMAHGSKIDLAISAGFVALRDFEAQEPLATVNSFNAVKTWLSGNNIKVKIYFNSNANSILYKCEMDHSGTQEQMVCAR